MITFVIGIERSPPLPLASNQSDNEMPRCKSQGVVVLLAIPDLRVMAQFMFHAHVQASKCVFYNAEAFPGVLAIVFVLYVILLRVLHFGIKEVIDTTFLLTHTHQLLRRALQFYANPQTQSKEK